MKKNIGVERTLHVFDEDLTPSTSIKSMVMSIFLLCPCLSLAVVSRNFSLQKLKSEEMKASIMIVSKTWHLLYLSPIDIFCHSNREDLVLQNCPAEIASFEVELEFASCTSSCASALFFCLRTFLFVPNHWSWIK